MKVGGCHGFSVVTILEGFQKAFEFASLRACLCEIHVFVKVVFRSMRMEREKRAM